MLKNTYKYLAFAAVLLLTSCTSEKDGFSEGLTTVSLYTDMSDINDPNNGVDAVTRATRPLDPEKVNKIRDIWILQYGPDGVIYSEVTTHERTKEPGDITLPNGLAVTLRKSPNTTVCLIANVGDTIDKLVPNWPPDNLTKFNNTKIKLDIASYENNTSTHDGQVGLLNNTYLFGYYQGAITNETTYISALLGRLAVRMNLTIINNTDREFKEVLIHLKNIPKNMYISSMNIQPLENEDFCEYKEYISKMPAGATAERYYYFGGSYNTDNLRVTELDLSADNGNSIVNFRLGGDPAVPDEFRDYSMYRNSTYTYTIEVRSKPEEPNP